MARNPELEAAILADPDGEAGYLVYADWLQQQGDPRGELAMAQAAGDEARAAEIIEANHSHLFVGLNGRLDASKREPQIEATWRLGWFERVAIVGQASGLPRTYPRLVLNASTRFLRELCVRTGRDGAFLAAVRAHGLPWRLRRLELDCSSLDLGDLSSVWPLLPELRELRVAGLYFELGTLALPHLTQLELRCEDMQPEHLLAVAHAHFPGLTSLTLDLGWSSGPASELFEAQQEAMRLLLARRDLPGLRTLKLRDTAFADELLAALVDGPLLAGLSRLDLPRGRASAASVERLIREQASFAHLDRLDLTGNLFDAAAVARLGACFPQARLYNQQGDSHFLIVEDDD